MMKFLHKIVLLFTLTIPLMVFAGNFDALIPLFSRGDASEIGRRFDTMVEVNIKGKSGTYSGTQATTILKDFFDANGASGFTLQHQGNASSGSEFAIGSLNTRTGTYKVSIFVKNNGGSVVIKELRIE